MKIERLKINMYNWLPSFQLALMIDLLLLLLHFHQHWNHHYHLTIQDETEFTI